MAYRIASGQKVACWCPPFSARFDHLIGQLFFLRWGTIQPNILTSLWSQHGVPQSILVADWRLHGCEWRTECRKFDAFLRSLIVAATRAAWERVRLWSTKDHADHEYRVRTLPGCMAPCISHGGRPCICFALASRKPTFTIAQVFVFVALDRV